MNAGLVREGVGANDGLVRRRAECDDLAEHLAGGIELFELDTGVDTVTVRAHVEGGGDLFKSGVAGAFTNAVDGAFHLACTGGDRGERVGRGKAEIVVAM